MGKRNFKGYICIVSLYISIVSRSKATRGNEEQKERDGVRERDEEGEGEDIFDKWMS